MDYYDGKFHQKSYLNEINEMRSKRLGSRCLCDIDSEFERGALVETVRSRLGASSVGDALTTPTTTAVASTLTAQQYVLSSLLHCVCPVWVREL